MKKLYLMAKGHTLRFPNGNEPFQITTRILEECGEVAQEVNRLEKSGIKELKHGTASKADLANEIRQAMMCLAQLAQYYECEDEVAAAIDDSIARLQRDGVL
ncbi:MAG: hypothetical protein IJA52_01645 [Clostridia bacterium]|nr:hypothetical protein [Clostridia bacterium]